MTERRIRHVPVVKDGRLTGIISIGDVVKAAMDQLQFERDQLDNYVHQRHCSLRRSLSAAAGRVQGRLGAATPRRGGHALIDRHGEA